MKVKVKVLATGDYGLQPFLTALESWVYRKTVEIAREPELYDWSDDIEREQALRIIKGIWDRLAENPRTAYMMKMEELDALEEATLKDIIKMDEPRLEKQHLLNLLQAKYPSHERDTLRRRVDNIVEKGRLDRIKEGMTTFYSLKATDRIRKEITA